MLSVLDRFSLMFWDFDGVIKDSVDAKTQAFVELFQSFGPEIAERVRIHHEANGGMSRFQKIPLYLEWAHQPVSDQQVQSYCDRFSDLVFRRVIDSPWVPGVREYLQSRCTRKAMYLVTATPQSEIEQILEMLNLFSVFRQVFGAPTGKSEAIANVISFTEGERTDAVMIGDSASDYRAACANHISFVLRRTPQNQSLQDSFNGPSFLTLSEQ